MEDITYYKDILRSNTIERLEEVKNFVANYYKKSKSLT